MVFDKNQSLVGDTGDVNMWEFVLSPEEINNVYHGGPSVLMSWVGGVPMYGVHGGVFTKPQLPSWGCDPV